MICKTAAIVLKNTNYSETSIICQMYTRELGVRTYILQSVRKGKSAIKPSMIQPLSLVDIDVYEKKNANINRIKELKNNPILYNIQDSMIKKSVAMFLVEILNQCITEEQYEVELFDFIQEQVLALENKDMSPLFPIRFLVLFSFHLGVQPQGVYSSETPYFSLDEGVFTNEVGNHTIASKPAQLLSFILHNPDEDIKVHSDIRKETLDCIIKYYQYHILKRQKLNSVEILSALLA